MVARLSAVIGQTFKDGSLRLVRDLPVGSPTWKRLYHQARNASESRNATFERWDLKRLPVYGGLRGKAFAYLADTWVTPTTLARSWPRAASQPRLCLHPPFWRYLLLRIPTDRSIFRLTRPVVMV